MSYGLLDIDDWQDKIEKLGKEKFPRATTETIINHLKDEVKELEESGDPEEIADCIFLLIHYAVKIDCRLAYAMRDKFQELNKRTYEQELNDRGYFKHIEE